MPDGQSCRFTAELSGYALASDSHAASLFTSAALWPKHPFSTLTEAQHACLALPACGGVSAKGDMHAYEASVGRTPMPSPTGGSSWVKLCNPGHCEVEEGVWYWGAHIRTVPRMDSVEGCCDACLATPTCVSFNYGGEGDEALRAARTAVNA